MDIPSLWREAFQEAVRTDLAGIVAKGFSLNELQEIGDAREFELLVRRKDLALLGLPSSPKHRSLLGDLFHIIYQCAPAFDVLAQSHFILTFTWGVCRLLVQVARDYHALSDKTKSIVQRILGYVDHWRDEASLYADNIRVKSSIRRLFHDIITLVALAKHHSQQHRWKKFLRALGPNTIEQSTRNLQNSADLVDRALRSAAGQSQYRHRVDTEEHWREHVRHWQTSDERQRELHQEIRNRSVAMTTSVSHCLQKPGGEVSISLWLTTAFKLETQTSVVAETCKWLFNTSNWASWSQGNELGPLVITGPPGSGKSSIVHSVIQELNADPSRPLLFYLFNSAHGPAFNTARIFLASILVQLYLSVCDTPHEAIFEISKHLRIHYSTVWQCPYPALLRLVEQVLDKCGSYVLIVDSVDECEEDRQSMLEFLAKFGSKDGVAVMATCRNPTSFDSSDHKTLEMQSYTELVRADLVRFVEHEIDSKLGLRPQNHGDLIRQVVEGVVDRSQNNFLHAKLLIKLLQQQSTPRQIREAINNMEPGYAAPLYEDLLKASNEKLAHCPGKLARRQCILRLLMAAQEPLTVQQIDEFLAMNEIVMIRDEEDLSLNIEKEIEDLCGSFISILASKQVLFFHTTAKEFFASQPSTTTDQANLYLANKCLSVLSQTAYRDPQRATRLLRQHLKPKEDKNIAPQESFSDSPVYEYAARYFHKHIIAVTKPPQDLVAKLSRFLQGTEFVTWSETMLDLKPGTSYAAQITVYASLLRWAQALPPVDQQDIQLERYFETAHVLLSLILNDEAEDKVLQYLPRVRLGDYLNGAGQSTSDWRKAYEQKQIVVEGLSSILVEKDPFLLRARASLLQEYLWQKRFSELLDELHDLYKLQKEVVGRTKDDIYITAWMIGAALVALGKYNQAAETISDTLEQVRQLHGEKYRFFNVLLLLEGTRLERVNDLDEAAATYRAATNTMTEVAGSQNIFVLTLKTALGSVLRKQGKFEEAEKHLVEGWGGRQQVFSINLNVCLDAALQLAMLYRDKGDGVECSKLLESIHRSTVFEADFERYCQLIHIRSLVALDNGEYTVAKHALVELIQSASGVNRAKNNRELLWSRIDLADAMRAHGGFDEALMLFSELVEPLKSTDMHEEPEPPSQLAVAERALRLVRAAKFAESEQMLQEEDLRWVREADFWFSFQGGPILDTSIIAPIGR